MSECYYIKKEGNPVEIIQFPDEATTTEMVRQFTDLNGATCTPISEEDAIKCGGECQKIVWQDGQGTLVGNFSVGRPQKPESERKDVMLRVIHPDVPIRPGIVKVRTTLTSEMAKTFLANSITLTPGTLTIDIDGDDFYVHWIYIPTDDPNERTREICGRFEGLLRRIFE